MLVISLVAFLFVARKNKWKVWQPNVDLELPVCFFIYWLGVGLFDYNEWYNNIICTSAAEFIVMFYSTRYLIFFADRFDRARGIMAGFPSDKGSVGCGRYFWIIWVCMLVGVADLQGAMLYWANELYAEWESDGKDKTDPNYDIIKAYETSIEKIIEYDLMFHAMTLVLTVLFILMTFGAIMNNKKKALAQDVKEHKPESSCMTIILSIVGILLSIVLTIGCLYDIDFVKCNIQNVQKKYGAILGV